MSRQADLYALSVKLDLQTAAFNKGVASANKSLDRMDRRFKKSGAAIKQFAKGLAVAFSVRAMVEFGKATIAAADQVDKASKTVGLTVERFQELSNAAELSGINMSLFESSMTAFVKRIGEAQNGMGPLVSGLKNMDKALLDSLKSAKNQDEAFKLLADAHQRLGSDAERAALMNAAFGRSGIRMGNMMIEGAKGVDHLAERMTVMSNENTAILVEMGDNWAVFWNNFAIGAQNMLADFLHSLSIMGKAQADFTGGQIDKEMSRVFGLMENFRDKLADDSWMAAFSTNRAGLERSIKKLAGQYGELAQQKQDNILFDAQIYENMTRTSAVTQEATGNVEKFNKALSGGGGGGAKKIATDMKIAADSINDLNEELTKMEEIGKSSVDSFASGFSDTLVDGIMDGKLAFDDFIQSFLAGIAKAILQAQILAGLKMIPGIGSLLGGVSSFSSAPAGISRFNSAPSAPSLYSSGAIATTSTAGRAAGVNVNVNNYADATVETQSETDESGNVNLTIIVENMVKSAMGSGRLDKAMLQNWGSRRIYG